MRRKNQVAGLLSLVCTNCVPKESASGGRTRLSARCIVDARADAQWRKRGGSVPWFESAFSESQLGVCFDESCPGRLSDSAPHRSNMPKPQYEPLVETVTAQSIKQGLCLTDKIVINYLLS